MNYERLMGYVGIAFVGVIGMGLLFQSCSG